MLAMVRSLIGAALMLVLTVEVRAQADDHRLEVGLQYTALKLSVLDSVESGIGGRFGVRANRYLTVEGEFTFFPKNRTRQLRYRSKESGPGRHQERDIKSAGWCVR